MAEQPVPLLALLVVPFLALLAITSLRWVPAGHDVRALDLELVELEVLLAPPAAPAPLATVTAARGSG